MPSQPPPSRSGFVPADNRKDYVHVILEQDENDPLYPAKQASLERNCVWGRGIFDLFKTHMCLSPALPSFTMALCFNFL